MDGCLISFLYLGFARPLRVFFELFTLAVSSLSLLKTAATQPDGTVRKHHEMPLVEAYHLVSEKPQASRPASFTVLFQLE